MNIAEQLRQEQINAAEADQVLRNPQFMAACTHVETMLADLRRQVPIRDKDMHTQLIQMEQLYYRFKSFLVESVQTGQLANLQLQREATRFERMQEQARAWMRRA